MSAGTHVSEQEKEAIRAARRAGMSITDLTLKFGRGVTTVREACRGIVPVDQTARRRRITKAVSDSRRGVVPDGLKTWVGKMASLRGPAVRVTPHFARTGTLPELPDDWWEMDSEGG